MKLGVSACLIGEMCRYDGAASKDDFILDVLKRYFDLVSYCPETIIFGSPRETIRQVEIDNQIKIFTTNTKKDVTKELDDISLECAKNLQDDKLCGFILKSKSPTCGIERVKVYQDKNAPSEKKGLGLFAKHIKALYPNLPIEDEGRLHDAWLKENFLMQIFSYRTFFEFLDTNPDFKGLVEFHTSFKYLIYAKSQNSYKELGNIVANHDKKELQNVLDEYKEGFLKAIAIKGNINKTYNVLLHIFGYFKKLITKEEKEFILDAMLEYKNGIIPLIAVIKIINLYVLRFDIAYLKTQRFLHPYPKELALRSDIKAYK